MPNSSRGSGGPAAAPRQHCLGLLSLNSVTIIWGSQHAMIKHVLAHIRLPAIINAVRFTLAAVVLVAAQRLSLRSDAARPPVWRLVAAGSDLALWQALGFTLQLVGLHWTSASRSAFLLYLNAPMVPFLSWALGERYVGLRTHGAALIAVLGTLLLTYDGGPPNLGDLLSVGAAGASAMFIVRLDAHSAMHDAAGLNVAATSATACLCCVLLAATIAASDDGPAKARDDVHTLLQLDGKGACGWEMLYLALLPTAFAGWLQVWGQARVRAHEAVVIYTLDPVWAALFAWLLLGETLHAQGLVGCAVVLCANMLRPRKGAFPQISQSVSNKGHDAQPAT
jgi:drug/metabolite transporter (DMT)-like permease